MPDLVAAVIEWREARLSAIEEGATPDRFGRLAAAESALMAASLLYARTQSAQASAQPVHTDGENDA